METYFKCLHESGAELNVMCIKGAALVQKNCSSKSIKTADPKILRCGTDSYQDLDIITLLY